MVFFHTHIALCLGNCVMRIVSIVNTSTTFCTIVLKQVPTEMSLETASGLLVAGLTAHFSIEDWGEVAPGEVVLIHSAAGAVGILCVQMALKKGAIVIATASPPKHGLLKKAGAHYIFNSRCVRSSISETP